MSELTAAGERAPERRYGWLLALVACYLLGLEFAFVPLLALFLIARYPASRHSSTFNLLALVLCCSLLLSALLGVVRGGDMSRFLSSLYSIIIVFFGVLLANGVVGYAVSKNPKDSHGDVRVEVIRRILDISHGILV